MLSLIWLIVVILLASFVVGCCATYVVRAIAWQIGFVDQPDGKRKIHEHPVALGGGVAVFATMCAIVGGGILLVPSENFGDQSTTLAVLQFSLILLITGLIDDSRGISGKYKLLAQVIAALVIVGSGTTVAFIDVFGYEIPLGLLGSVFTVLWLIGAVNSFNLLDGVDGLAASVGIVLAITIGTVALLVGAGLMAVVSFILAGALGGFLVFNRAPATIYLGDTGSMFVGGLLGVIALRCAIKEAAAVAFAVPLAIWAVPIFDSMAALVRRKLTGRSMYATDRGHIHHQLLVRGLSPNKAVLLIAGMCLITGTAAVAGVYFQLAYLGPLAAVLVIGGLIFSRVFGHSEAVLLNHRLMSLGRRIAPMVASKGRNGSHASIQFQGDFSWDFFWTPLIESTQRFNLCRIRLNVHLPHCHEDFFAQWAAPIPASEQEGWDLRVPLHCGDDTIGKLEVHGHDSKDAAQRMAEFLDFFQTIEAELYQAIQNKVDLGTHESPSAEAKVPTPVAESSPPL